MEELILTDEQALNLLESNAPISPSHTSDRFLFVQMRSEGLDNEEIADVLNADLEYIQHIETGIVEEFLK